jgi:alcohol dehydrogenase (cytochrome c)
LVHSFAESTLLHSTISLGSPLHVTRFVFYVAAWERGAIRGAAIGGPGYATIRALDSRTGTRKWEFRVDDGLFSSGVLTTASGLVFAGVAGDFFSARPSPEAVAAGANAINRREPDPARLADGYFHALDAESGRQLWRVSLAGSVTSGPVSYSVNGRQYVAIAAGNTLFGLALRR